MFVVRCQACLGSENMRPLAAREARCQAFLGCERGACRAAYKCLVLYYPGTCVPGGFKGGGTPPFCSLAVGQWQSVRFLGAKLGFDSQQLANFL